MSITLETQAAIEKFNTAVKHAVQARSKDVRLSMDLAVILMGELSNVMSRLAVLENASATQTVADGHHLDGGKF